MSAKVEIGFPEWFGMVCRHEPLAYPRLMCVGLLLIGAIFLGMHNAVVGFSLFFGLGVMFMWAFHRAWRLALKNPPWYLKSERSVAFSPTSGGDEAARTDND